MNSTPVNPVPIQSCNCCLASRCHCHADRLEPDGPDRIVMQCSCCLDRFCSCGGMDIGVSEIPDRREVRWAHASYTQYTPHPGWTIFLNNPIRHMPPERARRVAADLISAADYADQIAKEEAS